MKSRNPERQTLAELFESIARQRDALTTRNRKRAAKAEAARRKAEAARRKAEGIQPGFLRKLRLPAKRRGF
jgi:hypothetical protein